MFSIFQFGDFDAVGVMRLPGVFWFVGLVRVSVVGCAGWAMVWCARFLRLVWCFGLDLSVLLFCVLVVYVWCVRGFLWFAFVVGFSLLVVF